MVALQGHLWHGHLSEGGRERVADTVGDFYRPGPKEIQLTSAYLPCVTCKKE